MLAFVRFSFFPTSPLLASKCFKRFRQVGLSPGGGIFGFRCLVKFFGRNSLVAFDPEFFSQRPRALDGPLYPIFLSHMNLLLCPQLSHSGCGCTSLCVVQSPHVRGVPLHFCNFRHQRRSNSMAACSISQFAYKTEETL